MRRGTWLGVLLLLTVSSARGQEVGLAWKLEKDQKFFVETKIAIKNKLEALGKEAEEKTERSILFQFTVLEKNDKGMVLEEQVESTTLAIRGESPANRFINLLKEAKWKLTLDPKMKVTRGEGHEDIVKKLVGTEAEARKPIEALLGEETLKRGVEELFGFLPDGPVKKGATWKRETTDKIGPLGQCKRTITYTLEGKGKVDGQGEEMEHIAFTGIVTLENDKQPAGALPFQIVKADLKSNNFRGDIFFDAAKGRLVRLETSLTLRGPMTLKIGEVTVDAKSEQDFTITTKVTDTRPLPANVAPPLLRPIP